MVTQGCNLDKIKEETLGEEEGQVEVSIHLEVDLIINHKETKLHRLNSLNLMICLKN